MSAVSKWLHRYVERHNLATRMSRYRRKTNAFSRSMKYHEAAALYFVHFNFVCKLVTIKTMPAGGRRYRAWQSFWLSMADRHVLEATDCK